VPGPSVVVITPCRDYDPERVSRALEESIALAGLEGVPVPDPVLLKPNMLLSAPPERGVTTHPAVFAAAARYFKTRGRRVVFGDSPNGIFRSEPVARKCGLLEEAGRLGVAMEDFETGEDVSFPGGAQNRRFHIAKGALSAGFLVNLPKMKTHGLTGMTGALKNIFGVIPGNRKAEFHVRHPDPEGFSRMLVDLNALIKAPLAIMDAVEAMEGNGPSGGKIVEVGLLIVSRDPVALDAVACRIMGIDPLSLPLIAMAEKSGLGFASERNIEIRGTGKSSVGRKPFERASGSPGAHVPAFLMRFAKRIIVARPAIDAGRCVRCGRCIEACPSPTALSRAGFRRPWLRPPRPSMDRGSRRAGRDCRPRADSDAVPRYNYGACIRCYCCQEICPEGAILLKTPFLGRVLEGAS
jgi:uncharacterized protein (DUF362 family)/Pyruvate/2-oxoacid:ferredoxin oxidoreductase delta subunit